MPDISAKKLSHLQRVLECTDSPSIIAVQEKKIACALIHTVITQLKQCFSDLVIFYDKAYNSINLIFNTLFQLPSRLICCTFASVCYNYIPKKCLLFKLSFVYICIVFSCRKNVLFVKIPFPTPWCCSWLALAWSFAEWLWLTFVIWGFMMATLWLVAPKPCWVHCLYSDFIRNEDKMQLQSETFNLMLF